MIIEGSYYRFTPINDHSNRFDVELLHDVGGKNPRSEFKVVAYGISLDNAIGKAVMFAVSKKLGDEVVTLKQFLSEYKSEVAKIRGELGEAVS